MATVLAISAAVFHAAMTGYVSYKLLGESECVSPHYVYAFMALAIIHFIAQVYDAWNRPAVGLNRAQPDKKDSKGALLMAGILTTVIILSLLLLVFEIYMLYKVVTCSVPVLVVILWIVSAILDRIF